MTTRLLKRAYNLGMSGYLQPSWEEADYTGRWKIVENDGGHWLYLECFDIELYIKEVDSYHIIPERIEDRSFLWWKWQETFPEIKRPIKVLESKVRARVEWVHENRLKLEVETINQCEYRDQQN